MTNDSRRGAKEGLAFGLIAGAIFAVVAMLAAGLRGDAAVVPLRWAASVLLGKAALDTTSLGAAVVLGTIVHLAFSAAFGVLYGLVNARFSEQTQTDATTQAA